ncbi:MAG: amidohydrolase [Zavarzinella sp.]
MKAFLATALFFLCNNLLQGGDPFLEKAKPLVDKIVDKELASIAQIYKELHKNPELSLQEVRTAKILATELKQLGFTVAEQIGKTGIVGVLKNGEGPVVLVRTDMDGLPIVEATGAEYASTIQTRDRVGREVGVMHACGHDIHMANWIGTARTLVQMKEHWRGTLVMIGQPAEEIGAGARMMLAEGLYRKFPKPDFCIALHADSQLAAGKIHYTSGLAMANVDTVEIIIHGKGGHGSAPHVCIDPIVIAAKLILDLQTIASRQTDPKDAVVVTIGSIHAGTKANIIPNEATLQITVRTTKETTRKAVLEAIEKKAKAAALASDAPPPEVKIFWDEFTPKLENDPKLTASIAGLFEDLIGKENVIPRQFILGGEDFSRYALNGQIPIFMYYLGAVEPEKYQESIEKGIALPGAHTDKYLPNINLTLKTGMTTLSLAVMKLLPAK